MFGSEALEVAIGLVVLFSFLSLFATALREWLESLFRQRGRLIHRALEELFSPDGAVGGQTLKQFYDSILISPLFSGSYRGRARNLPSYIPSSQFASALLDVARKQVSSVDPQALAGNQWFTKIADKRLADLIGLAFRSAGTDPDRAQAFLERWFDSQMDRVSGWYRRTTQYILMAIGFGCALVLNVDAVAVTQHLYTNDTLRQLIVSRLETAPPGDANAGGGTVANVQTSNATNSAVSPPAPAVPDADGGTGTSPTNGGRVPSEILSEMRGYGFPTGWTWNGDLPRPEPQCTLHQDPNGGCMLGKKGVAYMIIGWLITAFAVSLGAPFWFDVLNKIMVIRSTVKPFEKSPPEASEDRQLHRVAAAPLAQAQGPVAAG